MCMLNESNDAFTQEVFHNLKIRPVTQNLWETNKRDQVKLLTSVYYCMWPDSYQHFVLIGA